MTTTANAIASRVWAIIVPDGSKIPKSATISIEIDGYRPIDLPIRKIDGRIIFFDIADEIIRRMQGIIGRAIGASITIGDMIIKDQIIITMEETAATDAAVVADATVLPIRG